MGETLARRVIGNDAKAHVIGELDGLLIAETGRGPHLPPGKDRRRKRHPRADRNDGGRPLGSRALSPHRPGDADQARIRSSSSPAPRSRFSATTTSSASSPENLQGRDRRRWTRWDGPSHGPSPRPGSSGSSSKNSRHACATSSTRSSETPPSSMCWWKPECGRPPPSSSPRTTTP